MATIITIDLDTMDDATAHNLAMSLARYITRNGGHFGFPGVQGTTVQHITEPVSLRQTGCLDPTGLHKLSGGVCTRCGHAPRGGEF